jgi:ABC-2 type transport system ATP-binding protein
MIKADGVYKRYGAVTALDGIDLTVPAGTVLGLLGPNGAGKSSLVRICTTLLRPDGGQVTVAGFDVVKDAHRVRRTIGIAAQEPVVDKELTGRENLGMLARLHGLGRRRATARVGELLDRFDLGAVADRRVTTYSGGTRRRLDLACAFVARPQVVFLDEPTVGLDPRARTEVWDLLAGERAAGVTVLLATQYLEEAEHLADRIVVMSLGRVLAEDTIDALKARYGEHRVDLVVEDPDLLFTAAELLERFAGSRVDVDRRLRRLVLPLPGGPADVGAVVDVLTRAAIGIHDIAVRRPNLDEVFLAITKKRRTTGVAHVGSGA